ncbi:hypothetical protein KHC33_13770 [Methanospirillum sp. J.3.6.1-F.2.7.3]|uniref:Uncharacterized protein n=1 Tax=Methanospirillum purgamenti TaxID=2834276 RepID=A0A8E7B0Y1_9EURY|nr:MULTISPECIES: hypothetical protein [Methanospirillum]MDX8551980.1 hypothetical protein [Methanospirillum hungatei]QVV88382.1 hypothetical protein KHC33_13770 [Methanospirillum sp. J.3.6.1-F.2.7.3]
MVSRSWKLSVKIVLLILFLLVSYSYADNTTVVPTPEPTEPAEPFDWNDLLDEEYEEPVNWEDIDITESLDWEEPVPSSEPDPNLIPPIDPSLIENLEYEISIANGAIFGEGLNSDEGVLEFESISTIEPPEEDVFGSWADFDLDFEISMANGAIFGEGLESEEVPLVIDTFSHIESVEIIPITEEETEQANFDFSIANGAIFGEGLESEVVPPVIESIAHIEPVTTTIITDEEQESSNFEISTANGAIFGESLSSLEEELTNDLSSLVLINEEFIEEKNKGGAQVTTPSGSQEITDEGETLATPGYDGTSGTKPGAQVLLPEKDKTDKGDSVSESKVEPEEIISPDSIPTVVSTEVQEDEKDKGGAQVTTPSGSQEITDEGETLATPGYDGTSGTKPGAQVLLPEKDKTDKGESVSESKVEPKGTVSPESTPTVVSTKDQKDVKDKGGAQVTTPSGSQAITGEGETLATPGYDGTSGTKPGAQVLLPEKGKTEKGDSVSESKVEPKVTVSPEPTPTVGSTKDQKDVKDKGGAQVTTPSGSQAITGEGETLATPGYDGTSGTKPGAQVLLPEKDKADKGDSVSESKVEPKVTVSPESTPTVVSTKDQKDVKDKGGAQVTTPSGSQAITSEGETLATPGYDGTSGTKPGAQVLLPEKEKTDKGDSVSESKVEPKGTVSPESTYGFISDSKLTVEPTSEVTPEPTLTVEPTVEVTPEPTLTVEPTIEVTSESTFTVEPTVEVTPESTLTVEPTSEVTPEPTLTVEPTVEVTPEPTLTVEPTIEVTPEPTFTVEPTSEVTPEPTLTVEPTIEVTPEPTLTVEPTIEVTPEPTLTVEPTVEVTSESTFTVEPTVEVTPEPTLTVEPELG